MSSIAKSPGESTSRRRITASATAHVAQELDDLLRQLRRQLWIRGMCLVSGLALVTLLALMVLDAILQPESAAVRFTMWCGGLAIVAELIRRVLRKPLQEQCSRLSLAWSLDQSHPQFEERLTSVTQFVAQSDPRTLLFVDAIATQVRSGIAICSKEDLTGQSLRLALLIVLVCPGIFVLGMLLAPERLLPSLANVLCPWHERILPRLAARVQPGHAEVAEGTDVEFSVAEVDESTAVLEILSNEGDAGRDRVRESHRMAAAADQGEFRFLLQDVRESLSYRIRCGAFYSESYHLTVHPTPVITGLQATVTFPEYTQLPAATVDLLTHAASVDHAVNVPVMTVLPGARVTVTGTASLPIDEAALLQETNTLIGKQGADRRQQTWEFEVGALPAGTQSVVQKCSVTMTSERRVPSDVARFEIRMVEDLPPTVEIEGLQGSTMAVRPDQSFEIPFNAVDDFGIQKLELAVQKTSEQLPSLTIIPDGREMPADVSSSTQQREGSTTLVLTTLNLKPGEIVSVWLRGSDNRIDSLGGSQSCDSGIITLQVSEDAAPIGQQMVQQQHEDAVRDLRTAIDHLRGARLDVEEVLKPSVTQTDEQIAELPAPQDGNPAPEVVPNTEDADTPADPRRTDKAAHEAREQIQLAQQALQNMQDRSNGLSAPMFQQEIKQAQEVSEQELRAAEQQTALIPLTDQMQRKEEAAKDAARELDEGIRRLEQIQADISKRGRELELAAQLDALARQQDELARRMQQNESNAEQQQTPQEAGAEPAQREQDQPVAGNDPKNDVRRQQDVAAALQKLAISDEEARRELFEQRAAKAGQLAEETQRLQEQQERLSQLQNMQEQSKQERDEQLMELIAKEQDAVADQTRELRKAQADQQVPEDQETPGETESDGRDAAAQRAANKAGTNGPDDTKSDLTEVPQLQETSLEEAGRRMNDASKQLRENNAQQAEAHAQQAAEKLKESLPDDSANAAEGTQQNAGKRGDQNDANSEVDSLARQQETVRAAIQAVRENRPEEAAKRLQEQIAERTEQLRRKADELLERPTDDEENQAAMKVAQEKLQQAARETKAADKQTNARKNAEPDNKEAKDGQPNEGAANADGQDGQKPQAGNAEPVKQAAENKEAKTGQPNEGAANAEGQDGQKPQAGNAEPVKQAAENKEAKTGQPNEGAANAEGQDGQKPQAGNAEPVKQAAENKEAKTGQPNEQQAQPRKDEPPQPARALEEATQALQGVCKSCQNCAQCRNPGSSSGSSGKSAKEGNQPGTSPAEDGSPEGNGSGKQLAAAAEKANRTAKKPTAEGARELSRDLNQLADQAASKSQFPGRQPQDADGKQAGKDRQSDSKSSQVSKDSSTGKANSNGKPGGTNRGPAGAIGNVPTSDQLDSPEQLRGPSTSNWTRSRRMLNGSVLDDRDARVPQEYRGLVEDYFEQLSRIESQDSNAAPRPRKAGDGDDQEDRP